LVFWRQAALRTIEPKAAVTAHLRRIGSYKAFFQVLAPSLGFAISGCEYGNHSPGLEMFGRGFGARYPHLRRCSTFWCLKNIRKRLTSGRR
jgi:hypothetical protein